MKLIDTGLGGDMRGRRLGIVKAHSAPRSGCPGGTKVSPEVNLHLACGWGLGPGVELVSHAVDFFPNVLEQSPRPGELQRQDA